MLTNAVRIKIVEILVRTDSKLSITAAHFRDPVAPVFQGYLNQRFPEIIHLRRLAMLNGQPAISARRCNTSRNVVRVTPINSEIHVLRAK